jgi:hypothetical protein
MPWEILALYIADASAQMEVQEGGELVQHLVDARQDRLLQRLAALSAGNVCSCSAGDDNPY